MFSLPEPTAEQTAVISPAPVPLAPPVGPDGRATPTVSVNEMSAVPPSTLIDPAESALQNLPKSKPDFRISVVESAIWAWSLSAK